MLISSAMRTLQTAEVLHECWRGMDAQSVPSLEIKERGYLASADIWMELIRMTNMSFSGLWIVGHNPGISDLVSQLTGDYLGMATADIVHIQMHLNDWTEIRSLCGAVIAHHTGRDA
jgi:phosphohistidine phosphatase